MLHQSWNSFSGAADETHELNNGHRHHHHHHHHHDQLLGNVLATHLESSTTLALSSVANEIASRVGDAMDYMYFQSPHQGGLLPRESSEEANLQEEHETSPGGCWKQYISDQVNRIRLDQLPPVPSLETPSTDSTDSGFCKELHELPV